MPSNLKRKNEEVTIPAGAPGSPEGRRSTRQKVKDRDPSIVNAPATRDYEEQVATQALAKSLAKLFAVMPFANNEEEPVSMYIGPPTN